MADLKQIIQELNAEISAENPTVSRVLDDGSRIVSYGDGAFAYYKPGEDKYQVYDAAGNLQGLESQRNVRGGVEYTTYNPEGQQTGQFVAENTPGLAGVLAPIALTAMGGYALGPAASGLLSTPAAAATSAGGMTLFQGGSVEDALRNAALAGLGAYGTQGLMGSLNNSAYDLSFAAADAAQLANQGLDAAVIAQNLSTYVDPTLAASLANTAANQAFALADANQLVQQGLNTNQVAQVLQASGVDAATASTLAQAAADGVSQINATDVVPNVSFQPQTRTTTQVATLPDNVTVAGQNVPGSLFDLPATSVENLLAASTLPPLPSISSTSSVQPASQQSNEQVVVAAPTVSSVAPTTNIIPGIVPAITAAPAPAPAPTPAPAPAPASEKVEVVDKKQPTPAPSPVVLPATVVSSPAPAPTPSPAPAPAPASEKVEVVDKKDKTITPLGPTVLAPLPPVPAEVLTDLPKPAQPPDNKSLFTPSDILRLIGLLGSFGAGASLTNTGPATVSTPPSDTMIGSTTPQFGPDYYAAVQRYYNAYMPETPRNVATPLQQWYENKFGNASTAQPSTPGLNTPPSGNFVPAGEYSPPMSSDGKWFFNAGQWYPNETVTITTGN